jgi:phosphoribosylglycinamide formyltransferase-1
MKHILFLASGNGGNLKFFHQALTQGLLAGIRLSVVADRECGAIEYAKKNGLPHQVINYQRASPQALDDILNREQPEIIVTNWHKVIDANTVANHSGRLINLHYSLLPAFGGEIGIKPIQQAYAQGCKFIGPTCHLVDEGVDTGRILSQAVFATDISQEDAVDLMFRKGCLILLNSIETILGVELAVHRGVSGEMYSPRLSFDEGAFDENFWHGLAAA